MILSFTLHSVARKSNLVGAIQQSTDLTIKCTARVISVLWFKFNMLLLRLKNSTARIFLQNIHILLMPHVKVPQDLFQNATRPKCSKMLQDLEPEYLARDAASRSLSVNTLRYKTGLTRFLKKKSNTLKALTFFRLIPILKDSS